MKLLKILTLFILLIASITLSAVSQIDEILINVSVVGAIKNPGIYKLPMGSKLSEAVKVANRSLVQVNPMLSNDTIPSQINATKYKNANGTISSKRNITIKRGSQKINVDLKQFLALGDETNNPILEDGDIVIVPMAQNFVFLYGEINSTGKYEIKQGDKLSDIFKLALGLKNSAYLDKIELVRYKEDNKTYRKIMINYNDVISNPDSPENTTLQDGDRIYVRSIPDFHKTFTVSVQGNAKFPGHYQIKENKSTLLEILAKAGGPNKFANIAQATLIRRVIKNDYDHEFNRLKSLSVSDMTPEEYSYYKSKSRFTNGLVDVDFKKLWETKDKKFDVQLKDGDIIYIPSAKLTVEVLGQVKNPGKYLYVKGKDYNYYINEADGFALNPHKKKIRVIKFKTGTWEKLKDAKLEPGDKLFIPEKPKYDYIKITKDILQILSGMATLYFVFK